MYTRRVRVQQDSEFDDCVKKLDGEFLRGGRPDAQVILPTEVPRTMGERRVEVRHQVKGQFGEVGVQKVALEGECFCGVGEFRLQLANDTGMAVQGLVDQTDTHGDNVGTGGGSVASQNDCGGRGGRGCTHNGHIFTGRCDDKNGEKPLRGITSEQISESYFESRYRNIAR